MLGERTTELNIFTLFIPVLINWLTIRDPNQRVLPSL